MRNRDGSPFEIVGRSPTRDPYRCSIEDSEFFVSEPIHDRSVVGDIGTYRGRGREKTDQINIK